jgi:hypothetical protein
MEHDHADTANPTISDRQSDVGKEIWPWAVFVADGNMGVICIRRVEEYLCHV